jgi:hypothetical protein
MFNQYIQPGTNLRNFPTDVINGETRLPPAAGHKPWRTYRNKKYYLPFEYEPCSQEREGVRCWFTYGEGKGFPASGPRSAIFMDNLIQNARWRGVSNVLMACAPDWTGRFRKEDVEQLTELGKMLKDPDYIPQGATKTFRGKTSASSTWSKADKVGQLYCAIKAFDNNLQTRWSAKKGSKDGWVAIELSKPQELSGVKIHECADRIRQFELQIKKDDQWQTIHAGTTIGNNYSAEFKKVKAQHVRLNILEATASPTIYEIEFLGH